MESQLNNGIAQNSKLTTTDITTLIKIPANFVQWNLLLHTHWLRATRQTRTLTQINITTHSPTHTHAQFNSTTSQSTTHTPQYMYNSSEYNEYPGYLTTLSLFNYIDTIDETGYNWISCCNCIIVINYDDNDYSKQTNHYWPLLDHWQMNNNIWIINI